MAYNKKGYYQRARKIQEFAREHYEPGRQDRSYKAIWRKYIYPADGMCYMTFLRYLNTEIPPEPEPTAQLRRQDQLSLFN